MTKMSISIYMKGDYEEFHALRRRKNKANSKPIYILPRRTPSSQRKKKYNQYITSQRSLRSRRLIKKNKLVPSTTFSAGSEWNRRGRRQNNEKNKVKKSRKRRKFELNLKKQTQFANDQNEHKYLYER